jgi:hypothetical protein
LFAVFGSFSEPVTCEVSVEAPVVSWLTTTVTVALAPFANPFRSHVIAAVLEQLAPEAVADTTVPVAGACAVNTIFVEAAGPALVTVAV